nr:putative reverse transcriptase domain-containing protein [Tanacetum cinerariifolium]
ETLTFRGNESNNGRESRLTVISCLKALEYMAKGCQIFLAQISAKKEEVMSEGKQLEDVPVIRDYPEVFPKDLTEVLETLTLQMLKGTMGQILREMVVLSVELQGISRGIAQS